jgi:phosphatidylinositol-3-phosphatase
MDSRDPRDVRRAPRRPSAGLLAIGVALAVAAVASIAAAASGAAKPTRAGGAEGVPALGHVFLIIGENTSASQIDRRHAPYLDGKLKPRAAWLTDYHSLRHTASLGDYIGMTSGQFTRCEANDALPVHCHQGVDNLFSQLDAAGVSWRTWAQSMDNPCDIVDHGSAWSRNIYSAHHNAPICYTRIEGGRYDDALTPARECRRRDVSMGSTAPNSASTLNRALRSGRGIARFNTLIPNDCANGHDPCGGNRIRHFDAFLRREVPLIMRSPAFGRNGLVLITWDEGSDPPLDPHHVLMAAIGGQVAPGVYGGHLTHYGLLRTLEDGYGVPRLGAAAKAAPITGIWRSS